MEIIIKSNFERTLDIPDEFKGKNKEEIEEIAREKLEEDFATNNELDSNEFWDSLEIEEVMNLK